MVNASAIHVGISDDASYLAYGDDSQFGDVLKYAFAITRSNRIRAVEARIAALKERFKIPKEMALHCRVLFSGQQREKAGIGHLTPEDVRSIVARAITIMNQGRVLIRYAVGNRAEFGAAIGDEFRCSMSPTAQRLSCPRSRTPKGF